MPSETETAENYLLKYRGWFPAAQGSYASANAALRDVDGWL